MASALAVLTAVLIATTAASPASADMIAAPQTLASYPVGSPHAAMTPDGHALVVWNVTPPETWYEDQPATYLGSWRSPGGTFGRPFVVGSERTMTGVVAAGNEGVVLAGRDPRGAIATFLRTGATRGHDQVLPVGEMRAVEPSWQARPTPVLAADRAGNVVAALQRADNTTVAFSRAPGTLFGAEELIADSVAGIATAMNPRGDAAIAMSRRSGSLDVSVRRAGETTFAPPQPSGITQSFGELLHVVVTPNGDVAVSDRIHTHPAATQALPNFAFRPADGTFSAASQEIGVGDHALVAGAGSDVSIVDAGPDGTAVPRIRDHRPDGSLTAPIQIGRGPVCDKFDAATVTDSGNLAIMYRTPCGWGPMMAGEKPLSLQFVERPAGGTLTPPVPIGPPDAGFPAVASTGSGAVLIAWLTNQRTLPLRQVQAIVRDGPAELALLGLGRDACRT